MCNVIMYNSPPLDYEKINIVKEHILYKNLLDFEEFKPLVDMFLNEDDKKFKLKKYCKKCNKNYDKLLREKFEIIETERGYFTIILPYFMTFMLFINNENKYYKLWNKLVNNVIIKYINQ